MPCAEPVFAQTSGVDVVFHGAGNAAGVFQVLPQRRAFVAGKVARFHENRAPFRVDDAGRVHTDAGDIIAGLVVPDLRRYQVQQARNAGGGKPRPEDPFFQESSLRVGHSVFDGGSADVYYDITFSWNGGSDVVNTKQGATPVAPSVPDYDDGDYAFSISDNMAMDSEGDLLLRISDNMAMDLDSGDIHFTSSWNEDDDE